MKEKNRILLAVYIAATAVLMDLTSVNIALPTISKHFGISSSAASLILLVSMLTSSAFALIAGKIIQISNIKRLLVIGFSAFAVLNFLSFLTTNFSLLLVIRFFSGFTESLIYVIGPAVIRKYLHEKEQQSSYGIWMMCTGIGISMGPFIGSFLVSEFNWNYVFLINVALSIAGLLLSVSLNKAKWDNQKDIVKFDIKGAMYSFLFIGSLVLGLNLISRSAGNLVTGGAILLLSAAFLFLFIAREKTTTYPIMEIRLYVIRNFTLTNVGFLLFFLVNVGSRFLRPFYFEEGKGLSTEISGMLMMISPVLMMILSPMAAYFTRITEARKICMLANFLLLGSMLMFSFWGPDTSMWFIILTMVVLGIAMGLYYPVSSYLGMNSVPDNKNGMASASISTSKSMGKLFGILVFGVVFNLFFPFAWTQELIAANQELLFNAFHYTFGFGAIASLVALALSFALKPVTKIPVAQN